MTTSLSPLNKELAVSRWLMVVAATLYPAWSLIYTRLFPLSSDPIVERLGVSLAIALGLVATWHPRVVAHLRTLMLALYLILGGHFLYLTAANAFRVEYVVGAFVTFMCLNVTISSRRYLVVFSLFAISVALVLAQHHGGSNALLFFFGMATIQLVSFISLVWRLNLESSLLGAREALTRTEANLKKAQQLAQLGSWEWDVGSRTITWSEGLYRLSGLPYHPTMTVEGFLATIHPADRQRVSETIEQALREKQAFTTEYRVVWPDGTERVIHGQGELILDEHGRAQRMLGIAQDITERKRADRYKDEFLSVISHELRTPLNFIMGFASVLDDEVAGPLNADQHGFTDKILKGAERMLALVNNLLDMSRMQAGKFSVSPEPAHYPALVQEAIASLYPLALDKQLSLESEVQAPDFLLLDDERILQVLTNLIDNAIKFTPAGGRIRVSVRLAGEHVLTEVADSGIGIDPADMPKLFTRFQQIDMGSTREAGGTGLGLSISKSIVEAHHGRIGVSSRVGEGSVFWFTLPLATQAAAMDQAHRVPQER